MKKHGKLRRIRRFAFRLTAYLIFVAVCLLLICNFQIHPYAAAVVRAKAQNEISAKINNAIDAAVRELGCTYSDMIEVHYGDGGRVAALSVDTVKVNLLRSDILRKALETLDYSEKHSIVIPIGTVIGGEITSGKGPEIPITVLIADALQCSVVTDFYDMGINQTLHTVSLKLKVSCKALLPSGSTTFEVSAECPIGETVLLGEIPQAYTEIHRLTDDITETEIDDIYDFGASVN